ncbi:putative cucumisin [Lupinus albus]|uniref:Putative cucumisin n=2 Tax=Lupinus albus TaxID=3870 RepID=A0A6A4Q3S5_LUPAL|nr:putative cucumisin [Lupinus albus]KAE9608410.1 putative cucumisin [Lupinus albus]
MPDIPKRWRGECESGKDFPSSSCNKKLIGARSFYKGFEMAMRNRNGKGSEIIINSPRDTDGHGTHTASTAAGSHVANASFFGFASGIARGMAPQARVAAYKVCWEEDCFSSDILAGMERAIEDGVNILSLSIGGTSDPYFLDAIAIGAFAATKRGIFVSCSAGNGGPTPESLSNVAPWIITVGAGTLDRDFPAYAVLGNKKRFTGVSLYSGKGTGSEPVGLVYNKGVELNQTSSICTPGSLDPKRVRGKVVVCDRGVIARVEKGVVVKKAGGVGMILANTAESGEESVADRHVLPTVAVGKIAGDKIREYVGSNPNPTVVLSFGGTVLDVKPAPVVAAFSSRGPNNLTPQILKPDVIGPGVNILAGWIGVVEPSTVHTDTRTSPFNILSGTSMSCPHISGLAALIKAAHPKWSPSAIKSALLTTAYTLDNTNTTLHDASVGAISTPWAHGAGHVDPQKALSPGLVYDASADDYITFLCSLNYTLEQVQTIAQNPNVNCSRRFSDPGQLNYPSFSILFRSKKRVVRYTRTLTNVGDANSVYSVVVDGPSTVSISVKPSKLVFGKVLENKRYTVTFKSKKRVAVKDAFGSITWTNSQHQVRSPVAFTWSR